MNNIVQTKLIMYSTKGHKSAQKRRKRTLNWQKSKRYKSGSTQTYFVKLQKFVVIGKTVANYSTLCWLHPFMHFCALFNCILEPTRSS